MQGAKSEFRIGSRAILIHVENTLTKRYSVISERRRLCRLRKAALPSIEMVTLAGLEPATSPAPVNKDALSPLSYSVVTIFMTVCGGAGA